MHPRFYVILTALGALIAKGYCALTTIGTADVFIFQTWARCIQMAGLINTYKLAPLFNHTPLVGWISLQCLKMAPNDLQLYAFYLRVPAILADFIAVMALLWLREKTGKPAWWAICLFAASPVAFIISGFHGNMDALVSCCVLLAAISCARGNPALCGLFLGLGCNFKVTPILFGPLFFFYYVQRPRDLIKFAVPAALVVLAGWGYPLLMAPKEFIHNAFGYSSMWGIWGITYLLRFTGVPGFQEIVMIDNPPEQLAVIRGLKLLVIGALLAQAWFHRKSAPEQIYRSAALVWATFFIFAPGFAAQYLIWLAPCFLLASERWYTALTVASSIALIIYYQASAGTFPWNAALKICGIL